MNDKKILLTASATIFIIYAISSYQTEWSVFMPSLIAFIAGAVYSIKKQSPFIFIIASEILVINSQSVLFSLLIQILTGLAFFIFYVSKDVHIMRFLIAAYIIIISVFAYWAFNMQILMYTILCISALFTLYIITGFQWRKIKINTGEEI